MKVLEKGERAPFSGSLLDDEALRGIDLEMTEKRICEKKLDDATSNCDVLSSGWPGNFVYFIMGFAVGAVIVGQIKN